MCKLSRRLGAPRSQGHSIEEMSDDNQQGAGKQALDSDVLAARAAEQRERDAAALAEREYDLARQAVIEPVLYTVLFVCVGPKFTL